MEKIKVINVLFLSGDSNVGRSAIINRIKDKTFQKEYKSTIHDVTITKAYNYERRKLKFHLKLIEFSSEELKYKSIPIKYINDSHIIVLVFSNIETLNKLKNRWFNYYKEHSSIDNSRFILVGDKSDLFGNNRDEIIKQGNEFAEEIDSYFIICSAKTDDNMDNLERFIISSAKRSIDENEKIKSENPFLMYEKITLSKNSKKNECQDCNKQ